MKSLLRWGTTLGLIGTATVTTWLGAISQAIALPTDEVVEILQGVPVFTIVDDQGAPLVAVGDNNQKVTGVFISQKEANNFFQQLKQQKPDVAAKVSVHPVSLGEVFKLAQTNAQKPDALNFAYVPIASEVQKAQQMPGSEFKGGVPLYVARGGQEQGYLTIQQNDQQVIPFFFEKSQITEMVDRFKQEKPDLASSIVIDVVPMENVIGTLGNSDDAMLKQIRLVPTEESIQFIRSITANQPSQ
ncbi:MAG: Tic22 family protein [Synechocystis sp.]|nr:Tic22 family protein [Synechocystis sp.]